MTSSPASPRRRHILSSINPDENDRPAPETAKRRTPDAPEAKEEQAAENENIKPRSSRIRLKSDSRTHRHRDRDRDRDPDRDRNGDDSRSHRHHHRRRRHRRRSRSPTPPNPYEREALDPDAAFRESLFDAMADDEGAAYWEGVYGQPIHVYSNERPGTQGELERMSDEEYAAHVRQKMWEKTHQGLLEERARREEVRKQKSEEEKRNRKLQEDMERSLRRGEERRRKKMWASLWEGYSQGWSAWAGDVDGIPWPVESGQRKDISEKEVRRFIVNGLAVEDIGEKEFAARLRDERVRWHPDKMQQKLGGLVDADVMKDITAIFQIIDKLWADTRSKA